MHLFKGRSFFQEATCFNKCNDITTKSARNTLTRSNDNQITWSCRWQMLMPQRFVHLYFARRLRHNKHTKPQNAKRWMTRNTNTKLKIAHLQYHLIRHVYSSQAATFWAEQLQRHCAEQNGLYVSKTSHGIAHAFRNAHSERALPRQNRLRGHVELQKRDLWSVLQSDSRSPRYFSPCSMHVAS